MNTRRFAEPARLFATQSGGTTIDQDAFGGNPFASALIQVARQANVTLADFPNQLRAATVELSGGHQVPEWSDWPAKKHWNFQLPYGSRKERRCVLILIVSEYSIRRSASLVGAARDERRLAAMFADNGFTVIQGIQPTRECILRALSKFRRLAAEHDVAWVYCTGHGIEANGKVFLLPGDYNFSHGYSEKQLRGYAVSVDRIASACRAKRLNFVSFAGCRTSF